MNYSAQIKVASMRGGLSSQPGWVDVKVDRASVLGNPFEFKDEKMRSQSIAAFRQWLWECIKLESLDVIEPTPFLIKGLAVSRTWKKPQPEAVCSALYQMRSHIKSGQKVRLLCWCEEGKCHADVIKSCLLWMLSV